MALIAALRPRSISFEWVLNAGTPRRASKNKAKLEGLGGAPGSPAVAQQCEAGGYAASGGQDRRGGGAPDAADDAVVHVAPNFFEKEHGPCQEGMPRPPNSGAGVATPRTKSGGNPVSPYAPSEGRTTPGGTSMEASPRDDSIQHTPSQIDHAGGDPRARDPCSGSQSTEAPLEEGPVAASAVQLLAPGALRGQPASVPSEPGGAAVPNHGSFTAVQQQIRMYLGGDGLAQMVAPGDVLVVRGNGGLSRVGAAGGLMGHAMVVVAPPRSVLRSSPDAARLEEAWPSADVPELWRVPTVESTRRETGLWEAEMVLYVDRRTRQLKLVGEVDSKGDLSLIDTETVELWQSPEPLRSDLRMDLMHEVLSDMRRTQASWSAMTAARAVLRSASWTADGEREPAQTMARIMASWEKEPICTSVVISFWQRYLHRVATSAPGAASHFSAGERVSYFSQTVQEWMDAVVVASHRDPYGAVLSYDLDIKQGARPDHVRRTVFFGHCPSTGDAYAVELIMNYMPIKADRGLPGDLIKAMGDSGWIAVTQVPLVFSQEVVHVPIYGAPQVPALASPQDCQ